MPKHQKYELVKILSSRVNQILKIFGKWQWSQATNRDREGACVRESAIERERDRKRKCVVCLWEKERDKVCVRENLRVSSKWKSLFSPPLHNLTGGWLRKFVCERGAVCACVCVCFHNLREGDENLDLKPFSKKLSTSSIHRGTLMQSKPREGCTP